MGRAFVCAAAAAAALLTAPAAIAADWKDALEHQLRGGITITDTGMDRLRITKQGTIVVLQKEGVSGDLASDMTYLKINVRDGQVSQAGGFVASMQNKKTSRVFKPGDRFFVYKISVHDDDVQYFLITADTFDVSEKGSSKQTRYKALLNFEFPKGTLKDTTAEALGAPVRALIVAEEDVKTAASAPKTVALGQTPAQVEQALGKPDKIIDLGAKLTWVYKDIKVVFVDGKVADVQ
jgi:hypothetical protein